MKYLILTTGQIGKSELTDIPEEQFSAHKIDLGEEFPLNLFSLLLSDVKLFPELMGDEQAEVTAVVQPEGEHTALIFDDEQTMIRAKLLVHGMGDTQWSADTDSTHAVRFSTSFTEKQLDEADQLGRQLQRLMADERAYRETPEALSDRPARDDGATTSPTAAKNPAGVEGLVAARSAITRQLIEIQAQFGICPCMG